MPAVAQAPSTNLITVTATDNGVPPLSDSKSFKVLVWAPIGPAALEVNNADAHHGIAVDEDGNYYMGDYGLELWVLNGTNVPASINSATNVAAYGDLAAAGFTLAQTWSGEAMSRDFAGTLLLGGVELPMVEPAGSKVVLALAAWAGDATSWVAAVGAGAKGGVIAFVNGTVDASVLPPPVPPDLAAGWDACGEDLVMTPLAYQPGNQTIAGLANDGYLAGSTVFFDANFNGILDADEPLTQTDESGHFNLVIDLARFDTNHNGRLDAQEGRLVVADGLDIATGLPLRTVMTAPVGSTVVNPLTTLTQTMLEQNPGMTTTQAQATVQQALGITNNVDLSHYDALAGSATNDPAAVSVLSAAAQIQDTVVQIAALVSSAATNHSPEDAAATVMQALAARAQTDGTLNLGTLAGVSNLITQSLAAAGTQMSSNVTSGAASVISSVNQLRETLVATAPDSTAAAQLIVQVQVVAQGSSAQSLQDAANGAQTIDDVVVAFTGAGLSQATANAPVGDLTGTAVQAGTFAFGQPAFRVNQDGIAVPGSDVTVIRVNGNQGSVTVRVRLSDGTATAAAGDYRPGSIDVTFDDNEISKTVDLSASLIANPAMQGGATINLSLSLAPGSPAGASLGSQTNAVVSLVSVSSPGTFAFSSGAYSERGDGRSLSPVLVTRSGGSAGAVTVVVTPFEIPGGAVAGLDFIGTPIEVTFQDGNLNRLVSIPILNERVLGADEPFGIRLSLQAGAPAGAAIGSVSNAVVTIVTDAAHNPQVRMVSVSRPAAGQCKIRFSGPKGLAYELQASSNLRTWRAVTSGVLRSGQAEAVDRVGTEAACFYRVRLLNLDAKAATGL